MSSPTQWTWVWVNSRSWWWTGRPSMVQFMGLQRVGHDWATELNWTESRGIINYFLIKLWYKGKIIFCLTIVSFHSPASKRYSFKEILGVKFCSVLLIQVARYNWCYWFWFTTPWNKLDCTFKTINKYCTVTISFIYLGDYYIIKLSSFLINWFEWVWLCLICFISQ